MKDKINFDMDDMPPSKDTISAVADKLSSELRSEANLLPYIFGCNRKDFL